MLDNADIETCARAAHEACRAFAEACGGIRFAWSTLSTAEKAHEVANVRTAIAPGSWDVKGNTEGGLFIAVARATANALATERPEQKEAA